MFLQPTNREALDIGFDAALFRQSHEAKLGDFRDSRHPRLRRDLHSRVALGRQ